MRRLFVKFRHHLPIILLTSFITLVFLAHNFRLLEWSFVNQMEHFLYDSRLQLTMPGDVDPTIVIVDIDEKSLSEIGRWPWGRDKLARLVTELFDYYKVSLIGFDVIFREPDNSSGIRVLNQLGSRSWRISRHTGNVWVNWKSGWITIKCSSTAWQKVRCFLVTRFLPDRRAMHSPWPGFCRRRL